MDRTLRYDLSKAKQGDRLADEDYKYTYRDREKIANLLYLGAEGHVHDGNTTVQGDPDVALVAEVDTSGGVLPAGYTIRYKYTLVDEVGNESAPSPEVSVVTPSPVIRPSAPTLSVDTAGGTLLTGSYFYAVSAYETVNTQETTVSERVYITVPRNTTTGAITITMPSVPTGADGFNIYTRYPGASQYEYLDSVAAATTSYIDDGSVTPDCNRTLPSRNTTGTSCSVTLTIPGATPTVPDGYTWKVYRSYNSEGWEVSYLTWVVEETSEGSGIITPEFVDTGLSTSVGSPPSASEFAASPSKIDLTDGAHVQGQLPSGMVYHPHEVTFTYSGPLFPQVGSFRWTMPFTEGRIEKIVASLGVDFSPAADPVQIDVLKYDANAATPSWASIFNAPYLEIPVGESSEKYTLVEADTDVLLEDDELTVDIVQVGGGATPTDADLTVQIILWVKHGSATTSFDW